MNIIRATNPYRPHQNKDAYIYERDPKINDVLKYLKTPYLRLYPSRIDAVRNTNPFNRASRIKTDLNIRLGDTRKKLWYGTDNNQKLIDARKRLALSKLNITDDLNEKIGEEFTQKAGKRNKKRNKSVRKKGGMNKKKGGMNKKKDVHSSSWENPHVPGKKDCCPCVFHYMGLINDDEYIELYDRYSETGMSPKNIETFFKNKYPHFDFSLQKADLTKMDKNNVSQFIVNMFKNIKKGHVAVGGIVPSDGSDHCIVYSRTNDGQIAIHDSQMNKLYKNSREVTNYFIQKKVRKLYFLFSNYEKNKTNKLDKLILNSNNSPENFYTPNNSSIYLTPLKTMSKSKSKTKTKSM